MALHSVNIRHKGQITLPASIRQELGLEEGDRLIVERRGQEIVLISPDHLVDPTEGALAKYPRKLPLMSADELRMAVMRASAEENVATLRQIELDNESD